MLSAAYALRATGQAARSLRVAWVSTDRRGSPSPNLDAFRRGMRELGYVEGQDVVIDSWWADGSDAEVERMAPEVVRTQPEVIVAAGGLALFALLRAGVKSPI